MERRLGQLIAAGLLGIFVLFVVVVSATVSSKSELWRETARVLELLSAAMLGSYITYLWIDWFVGGLSAARRVDDSRRDTQSRRAIEVNQSYEPRHTAETYSFAQTSDWQPITGREEQRASDISPLSQEFRRPPLTPYNPNVPSTPLNRQTGNWRR